MEKELEVIKQATNEQNEIFMNRALSRRARERKDFILEFDDGTKIDTSKYSQYGFSDAYIAIAINRELENNENNKEDEEVTAEPKIEEVEPTNTVKTQVINGVEYVIGEESEIMQDENGYYTLRDGERHPITDPEAIKELLAEKQEKENEKKNVFNTLNSEQLQKNVSDINEIVTALMYNQKMKTDENVKNANDAIENLEIAKKNEKIRLSQELPIDLEEFKEKTSSNISKAKERMTIIDQEINGLTEEIEKLKNTDGDENKTFITDKENKEKEISDDKLKWEELKTKFESKVKELKSDIPNRENALVELMNISNEITQVESSIIIHESELSDIKKVISESTESKIKEIEKQIEAKKLEKKIQEKNCINRNNMIISNISQKYGIDLATILQDKKIDLEKSNYIQAISKQIETAKEQLNNLIDVPTLEISLENESEQTITDKIENVFSSVPEQTLNLLNNKEALENEIAVKKSNIERLTILGEKDYVNQSSLVKATERIDLLKELIKDKDKAISNELLESRNVNNKNENERKIARYKGNIKELGTKIRLAEIELNQLDPNSKAYAKKQEKIKDFKSKQEAYKVMIEQITTNKTGINQEKISQLEEEKEKYQLEIAELEAKKHSNGFLDLTKKAEYFERLNEEKRELESLEKVSSILNGKTLDELKQETVNSYTEREEELYDEVENKISLEKASIKDIGIEMISNFKDAGKNLLEKISSNNYIKLAQNWLIDKYNRAKFAIASIAVGGAVLAGSSLLNQNINKQTEDFNKANDTTTKITTEQNVEANEEKDTQNVTKNKLEAVRDTLNEMVEKAMAASQQQEKEEANIENEFSDMVSEYIQNGDAKVSTTAQGAIDGDYKNALRPNWEEQEPVRYMYHNEEISAEEAWNLMETGENVSILSAAQDGTPLGWTSSNQIRR